MTGAYTGASRDGTLWYINGVPVPIDSFFGAMQDDAWGAGRQHGETHIVQTDFGTFNFEYVDDLHEEPVYTEGPFSITFVKYNTMGQRIETTLGNVYDFKPDEEGVWQMV